MKTSKVDITEGLTIWKAGAHTVTTIEVQALRLWAGLTEGLVVEVPDQPGNDDLATRDGKMIAGFLSGIRKSTDGCLAQQLLVAKEAELQAGRPPMSIDPIYQ